LSRRALDELGLSGPGLRALRLLPAERQRTILKQRGRTLLARYHPDRNPGNPLAEPLFKAISQALLEAPLLLRQPSISEPARPISDSSPPPGPGGGELYARALRDLEDPPARRFDPRKSARLRPR
jgi:hypothetical protein